MTRQWMRARGNPTNRAHLMTDFQDGYVRALCGALTERPASMEPEDSLRCLNCLTKSRFAEKLKGVK